MSAFTITAMRCPCCSGTGNAPMLGFICMWCRGKRRLPTADALRYADHVYMLAGGGYIAGDHDLADMRRMEAEAEAVYALARKMPPWRVPSPNPAGVSSGLDGRRS